MVTDHASAAANWRLFCPASWDDTTITDPAKAAAVRVRRADAGIPDEVRHREKWRLALDMLDQMIEVWGLPKLPVVSDSGYGDCAGRGRPPRPAYPDQPATLKTLALRAGRGPLRQVTWRRGTRTSATNPTAAMRSKFLAIRVRPANRDIGRAEDGSLPDVGLIAEWPPGEPEPVKYRLSNMDTHTPLKTLVRLAKIRWRVEHD